MPLPGFYWEDISMVIQDVLRMADELSPNAFSEETKIQFLNEAEGVVQTEVFLLAVEDVITYSWPEDKETELLAEPPHDKLYLQYVAAQIDYANGEYKRYQNKMQMYNAYLSEFMRWFAERYRPADTHGAVYEDAGLGTPWRGYYISPYGIAVKHGFSGTEAEWLASLHGERGETGAAGRDFQIKGYFDTLENLQAAVPEPEPGETYFVGTSDPYVAYMWDGIGNKWVPNGTLQGPVGPQGIQGPQGIPGNDGAPGKDGEDGRDGYTPQKGVDYFDGKDGEPGKDGKDGENGKDGAPGTPGRDGYTPQKGVDYFDGKDGRDGYTPQKGVDYFDGEMGAPGRGISSVSVDKNGYLTITYTDGSAATLFNSIKGEIGPSGTSIRITGIEESNEDGGINLIRFSDGSIIQIQNGTKGEKGDKPIRGTDYWTKDDKADVVAEAVEVVTDNVENAKSVLYVGQNLSEQQKNTARSNISAANDIVCSVSGENIEITDSSDQALHGLKIFGKSTQITTTGKNLVDSSVLDSASGITKADGVYSGTVSSFYAATKNGELMAGAFEEGKQYVFSVYAKKDASAPANSTPYIAIRHTDGTIAPVGGIQSTNFKRYSCVSEAGKTVEKAVISYGDGPTVIVYVKDIQLEQSTAVTDYEPYSGGAPSPSPDYPQDITSVGDKGEVSVKLTGKNLFGGDALADKLEELSEATIDEEAGTVYLLAFKATGKVYFSDFKPNTQYTFIFKASIGTAGRTSLSVKYTDGTTAGISTKSASVSEVIVYTSVAGKSIEGLIGGNYAHTTLYYNECGIFEGVIPEEVALEYFEPYKPEQTLTIPTIDGLRSVSNVCDEIDYERGVYVQRIGKIDSYAGESVGDAWISSTGELSTGATVVYQLAEPIETPLTEEELNTYRTTHTNKPNTIVSNDESAEMEVSYAADTKLYIDNKFAEMAAAILNNA